jgi:hypothetical protein
MWMGFTCLQNKDQGGLLCNSLLGDGISGLAELAAFKKILINVLTQSVPLGKCWVFTLMKQGSHILSNSSTQSSSHLFSYNL